MVAVRPACLATSVNVENGLGWFLACAATVSVSASAVGPPSTPGNKAVAQRAGAVRSRSRRGQENVGEDFFILENVSSLCHSRNSPGNEAPTDGPVGQPGRAPTAPGV